MAANVWRAERGITDPSSAGIVPVKVLVAESTQVS
jgi:hypothetical protein